MELNKKKYTFVMSSAPDFDIVTSSGDLRFIESRGVAMCPVTGRAVIFSSPSVSLARSGNADRITVSFPDNTLFDKPEVVFELHDEYVAYRFRGTVKRRTPLNKWRLLQKGSRINAIDVVDFKSHLGSERSYQVHQTVLARRTLGTIGLDVSTEDVDLMFAPHPMLFVFRHLEHSMLIGPMGLVAGESLHLKMTSGSTCIDTFNLEVGPNVYWVEKGELLESPRFMFCFADGADVYGMLSVYTGHLVSSSLVRPKTPDDMAGWWYSPMWCSFGDQHNLPEHTEAQQLALTPELLTQAVHNINDRMLEKVAGVITTYGLPIRTLIIDDRWYTFQGDMRADMRKFPDMRATVDRLHARGFKVLCWASLYQFERESEAFRTHPEWFIVHHYPHNLQRNPERDIICADYSDPAVVDSYIVPLIEMLLSDRPGCYNFDGIKFDWPFLLPHGFAFDNREWDGKETTIHRVQKVVYDAAKAVKPDALIIGVSPHPFFNDTQDIVRTYDVATFDPRVHLERARYVRAVAPGMVPALDEHVYHQNFFRYMKEAGELGIPMIYNLLKFNGDGVAYTTDDYRRLREILDDYVERNEPLKRHFSTLPRPDSRTLHTPASTGMPQKSLQRH